MDNSLIGNQITKFRKAKGLTQEELGRSVGVSTQAVSRWECGGAPDITLLPAIADRLGVTVDALFGREGVETVGIQETVRSYFKGVPREQFHDKLCRLIWIGVQCISPMGYMPYLDKCIDENGSLIDSVMETDHGIYFGVNAEDMAFSAICPKPDAGYRAYFADSQTYCNFFDILATPGVLDSLLYLLSQKCRFVTAELLAKETGTEVADMKSALTKMEECHLVTSMSIQTVDGKTEVYSEKVFGPMIPFLYLARHLSEHTENNYLGFHANHNPFL